MKRVIRILLCGGLGNQLFQYAFGRALAERYGARLQIDINTGFARDYLYRRNYELDVFQLSDAVNIIDSGKVGIQIERIKLGFARRNFLFKKFYLIESNRNYIEIFESFNFGSCITTYGYWQDVRYFSDIEERLRTELQFSRKLSPENQLKAQEMCVTDSVAIHVRRIQYDFAVGIDYYKHAISRILEQVPNAKFYCFGDDLDWCRENLLSIHPIELTDNRNLPAAEDFQLMTNCKHYVTADSSFSWWAAWIGGRHGQVIAPISKGCKAYESTEKSPQHWQFIDCSK